VTTAGSGYLKGVWLGTTLFVPVIPIIVWAAWAEKDTRLLAIAAGEILLLLTGLLSTAAVLLRRRFVAERKTDALAQRWFLRAYSVLALICVIAAVAGWFLY